MCCYWARFITKGQDTFRLDTRIYLNEIKKISVEDVCIGAVVGKNPGSAIPIGKITGDFQTIDLKGDNLLPNVKKIFLKAYTYAKKPVKQNSYIQVLNLMYICDKDLNSAIKKIKEYEDPMHCETEGKSFPFLWYLWGNEKKGLNIYKKRFNNLKVNKHFYYHTKEEKIVDTAPGIKEPARHTQGLQHDLVVPFISTII